MWCLFVWIMNSLSIYSCFNIFPLILSPCRFSCCPSSSSAGPTHGLVSRDTASSDKPPASQKLLPAPLPPPRCAAAPGLRCQTPAPAAPPQTWAHPQRFVLFIQLYICLENCIVKWQLICSFPVGRQQTGYFEQNESTYLMFRNISSPLRTSGSNSSLA